MASAHAIDKSKAIYSRKTISKNTRKRRDARLVGMARAQLRHEMQIETHADKSADTYVHDDVLPTSPRMTLPHFDDRVMSANSAEEVHAAMETLPVDACMKTELTRAIAARYKRLERDMGFATSGLRRMVCLGAMCMSLAGLTLAVSGLHLGALSLAAGASVLALFIVLALATYMYRCVWYRYTRPGQLALAQHREVLNALRELCQKHNIRPDSSCRMQLDRCRAVIRGDVGFVALEVLRGTILEPLVSAISIGRRKLAVWRLQRSAAADKPI